MGTFNLPAAFTEIADIRCRLRKSPRAEQAGIVTAQWQVSSQNKSQPGLFSPTQTAGKRF